jgi:O-methyltransferase
VLAYDVPGDLVEIGTFTGETAALIGKVAHGEARGAPRRVHVYDTFDAMWGAADPLASTLRAFAELGAPPPEVHRGRFEQTLPQALPERIAFAHLDTGCGRDPQAHADQIAWLLELVYPRLAPGAIVSLMDYHDPVEHQAMICPNPGVKPGADRFLADKPEKVSVLHGGDYGHGYFRRAR